MAQCLRGRRLSLWYLARGGRKVIAAEFDVELEPLGCDVVWERGPASCRITEVISSPSSSWQNPYVERVIGSTA